MINITNLDPDKIEIDEKSNSFKSILVYYTGFATFKDLRYVKVNCLNPLYLIVNKIDGYFEEINRNKYLTLVPTNQNEDTLKKYKELRNKIRELITSATNNLNLYDGKYIKIKLNSDDDLSLKKMLELLKMIIAVRVVFDEDKKYYQQVLFR